MSPALDHTVIPPQRDSLAEVIAVLRESHMPALVGPDGQHIPLPVEVFTVLRDAVMVMAEGKAVTIAPHDTVMTTQEAADFLGLSRPSLVKLLEEGQIEYSQPGRHRRVRLADLIEYRERIRVLRASALLALTRDATADGARSDPIVPTR